MKRIALALAAVAAIGSVSAIATEASAQGRHDNGRWDRHDNGRHNGWDNNRGRDNRGYDNRRWDRGRDNGYYLNQRFYYGPPPAAYYGRPGFRPGYQRWARGQYLPNYYWGPQYVVNDYRRYGLRAPPRGYRWYNVNGDYVLAALAGGLIAEALFN